MKTEELIETIIKGSNVAKAKDDSFENNGYAKRGKIIEAYIVEALRTANVPLDHAGDDQVELVMNSNLIACTPDGLILTKPDLGDGKRQGIALEIKTIDPRTNRAYLPKAKHSVQVRLAGRAFEEQGIEIVDCWVLYVDASNLDDMIVYSCGTMDDMELARWEARAKKVLGTRQVGVLDREGLKTGDCKFCPHLEKCGVDLADVETRAKGKANRGSKIDAVASRLIQIKDEKKAIEAQEKDLKTVVIADLTKRKKDQVVVGDVELTLTKVPGRKTYDTKQAISDGLNLTPYEKVGKPSVRLDVKRV